MKERAATPAGTATSEILILADGQVLAHNISPAMARVLTKLDPANEAMRLRAEPDRILKHEIPG
jgi:hypothetical protein